MNNNLHCERKSEHVAHRHLFIGDPTLYYCEGTVTKTLPELAPQPDETE